MPCAVCDERIVTKLDGHACPTCDRLLHTDCAGAHACEEDAS